MPKKIVDDLREAITALEACYARFGLAQLLWRQCGLDMARAVLNVREFNLLGCFPEPCPRFVLELFLNVSALAVIPIDEPTFVSMIRPTIVFERFFNKIELRCFYLHKAAR